MHKRNRLGVWTGLCLVAALGAMSAMMGPPGSAANAGDKAEVGKPAPDFTLKDVNGKEHKLSDLKGKNVVLEWINPQCPVCNRVMSSGLVAQMREELKAMDKDFVHLAINSTSTMDAQDSVAYLKKYKLNDDIIALDDSEGTVGHLYDAKTTPHMYLIDAKGILRYAGAIDNDQSGRKSAGERTNYVVNAMRQMLAGETVTPEKTRSYGCAVKYKR